MLVFLDVRKKYVMYFKGYLLGIRAGRDLS